MVNLQWTNLEEKLVSEYYSTYRVYYSTNCKEPKVIIIVFQILIKVLVKGSEVFQQRMLNRSGKLAATNFGKRVAGKLELC